MDIEIRELMKKHNLPQSIKTLYGLEIERIAKDYAEMQVKNSSMPDISNSEDFKGASLPLIKYLCENHHPHMTAIVTPTSCELLEGKESHPKLFDYVVD